MKKAFLIFISISLGFWSSPSEARRGRFFRHQGHIKGFNPCGWNTCRIGSGFRRPIRRGFFRRRMFRGGCQNGGSCQPRLPQEIPAPSSPGAHAGNPGRSGGGSSGGEQLEQAPSIDPSQQRSEAPQRDLSGEKGNGTLTPEQIEGAKVFTAKCASCHEGNGPGPDFSNWTEQDWKTALKRSHLGDQDKDRMPPPSKPALSAEELKNLKAFLELKAGIQGETDPAEEDLPAAPGV